MDIFEVFATRHSYRGEMHEEAVPREMLKKIVQAGIQAPSGKDTQSAEFVVIDDQAIVREIRRMHQNNKAMQQAPAFIACIVDSSPECVLGEYNFQIEDCAAAVENMLLAITALGYASGWVDGWLRFEGRAEKIGRMIALPEGKVIRVLLPVGKPREIWQQKEKKPFAERAWFNTYGR